MLERTLVNLRAKKIRKGRNKLKEKRSLIVEEIKKLVDIAREDGSLQNFFTKSGMVSVKPIKHFLPKSLWAHFTVKELRKIINRSLRNK